MNWDDLLLEQLTWHWDSQARPRLEGLTDEEYLWEPAEDAWNVRPRDTGTAPIQAGTGDFVIDFAFPEPEPPPVTTIAWRLAHIVVGIFGTRVASHFDGPPMNYQSFTYAGRADEALAQLDEGYARWVEGVRGLDEEALARPVGEAEGPWADRSMAVLVLHIHREVIHHMAEIALLRDLWGHGLR